MVKRSVCPGNFRFTLVFIVLGLLTTVPLTYSKAGKGRAEVRSNGAVNQQGRVGRVIEPGRVATPGRITEAGMQQIAALVAEKDSRTPAQRKIDSQLLQTLRESRGQQMAAGVNLQSVNVGVSDKGKLLVDISAKVSDDLIVQLQKLGSEIIYPSREYKTIRARINLSDTETIAGYPEVIFIRPAVGYLTSGASHSPDAYSSGKTTAIGPTLLASNSGTGNSLLSDRASFAERVANVRNKLLSYLSRPATSPFYTGFLDSEGDRAHRADDVRNTYGVAGEGIRIGVLSDSFNNGGGEPRLISTGDLPGTGNPMGNITPVTVVQEDSLATGSDEGAAMLEIVHDIAPKAQLFFATADLSEASFASNILALRNAPNNCDIIIDDVFYFDESPFQDGIVAQAVNTVTASGALYFSSAGNEGSVAKNTAGVWEGDFNDVGSTLIIPGNGKVGTVHNFGTATSPIEGDSFLTLGQAVTLQWSDPLGASNNDYDLFVMDSSLTTVKSMSTNIQNGTQDPVEILSLPFGNVGGSFIVPGDQLVVFKTNAAQVRAINLNTFRGSLAVATTGQTHGHSAAVDAFSVAAAPASVGFSPGAPNGPFPNAFSSSSLVEPFTSDGPRRIFYNADGTPITPGNVLFRTNGGVVRKKPDITAADGVSTFTLGPFFGTSAAAPHAGAIAALLKSADPSLTPGQIRSILTSTALDVESTGYDNISGFGIIQAFQAMQAVQSAPSTPLAHLELGTVTVTEGAFGNGNGVFEPGEVGNVIITLSNPTQTAATNVKATLTSVNGAAVIQDTASYGRIAAGGTAANIGSPFIIGVQPFPGCGEQLKFLLTVTLDSGQSPEGIQITIFTGENPGTISSTLGQVPPTSADFTSTSGTQTGRLNRNGTASACTSPPKAAPGLADATGQRKFDAYTFTNHNDGQCVTVTMTSPKGGSLYVAVYDNNGFDPANPNSNFLGDSGSLSNNQSFIFFAPAGQSFTVVVHEVDPGGGIGVSYNLDISLRNCASPPNGTPITISPTTIPSGSVGIPYNQSFSAIGGSGFYNFALSSMPTGLELSGNTLSGTPTEAGTFTFVVEAADIPTGRIAFQQYFINISGTQPASITATAGDYQSVSLGGVYPIQLRATVRDALNNPLSGVAVTFVVQPPTNNVFLQNLLAAEFGEQPSRLVHAITDANGVATTPPLRAVVGFPVISVGPIIYNVTASVQNLPPVVFTESIACAQVVTNNADSGPGSLRDAVANACDGSSITFAPNVTGVIALTSGEIVIENKNLFITGPGANVLSVSGSHLSRIFNVTNVPPNGPPDNIVLISGLTLRDGNVPATTLGGGGAIFSFGSIIINDSVITNNTSSQSITPEGGAIDIPGGGTLTMTRCAIINNSTSGPGGGLHIGGSSNANISNSTIAGNSAGNASKGGGMEIEEDSHVILTNTTVYGNSANIGGNIQINQGDPFDPTSVTFGNCIIAGGILTGSSPSGPDLSGSNFQSNDFNLIQDITSALITGATTNNIIGVSPLLLPLGNYGGPSPTMPPPPSSPVLNAGSPAIIADRDQRGLLRKAVGRSDIGAVGTNYSLELSGGTAQSAPIKTTFAIPLRARVTESGSNISGIDVTFTAPLSGASGLFDSSNFVKVSTDSTGLATAPVFTANGIGGTYVVTASIGGAPLPTIKYELTNLAIAASISATSGTPQSTAPGATFPNPLRVIVRDSNSNPLSGVNVTFTPPASGASGRFEAGKFSVVIATDSNGEATTPLFTANNTAGSYTITATVDGNVLPALFSLNNVLPGPSAAITATSGTPQSAGIGLAFGATLQATVTDSAGIPVNGATVTFTIVSNGSAGGTFPGNTTSATSTTDVNGRAISSSITANQSTGTFIINATVDGIQMPAIFNLTNVTIVFGDLSGDGQVTVQDLVMLANFIAGNVSLTPTQRIAADVFDDHTEQITIQDLVTLANFIAGNIHSLPVVTGSVSNPGRPRSLADSFTRQKSTSIEIGLIPSSRRM